MASVERVEYDGDGLSESMVAATPWDQLTRWLDAAVERGRQHGDVPEPSAMSFATVDEDGHPNVRVVLLRLLDPRGPGFVTDTSSAKARELASTPYAAATLAWPALFRAVRFRGPVERVEHEVVDGYFGSRPWDSRVSAWASTQSAPVSGRDELERAFAEYAERFPDRGGVDDVPVPPTWGGYRIVPDEVEFWAGRLGRLHDRLVFTRVGAGTLADAGPWQLSRRQP